MHDPGYWSDLYASGRAPTEWFLDPSDLTPILAELTAAAVADRCSAGVDVDVDGAQVARRAAPTGPIRVLDVGCGTSAVGAELVESWPHGDAPAVEVDAVDFAPAAVAAAAAAHPGLVARGSLRVRHADVLAAGGLPFVAGRFELVIDKGTLDAIVHGYGPAAREAAVGIALAEVSRVTAAGGRVLQVSDEPPELRLPVLAGGLPGWGLSWREVGDGYTAFVYTARKPHPGGTDGARG